MVQRWCFFLQFILFLFLAVLDLPCCSSFSLVAASGGDSLVAMCGLLIAAASLIAEPRLWSTWASLVEVHGLSCPAACGIFLDQGLNPGLLPWQADSLPLSHYGSPILFFFKHIQPLHACGESAWNTGGLCSAFCLLVESDVN